MAAPSVNVGQIDDVILSNKITDQIGDVNFDINKANMFDGKKVSEVVDKVLLNGSYIIKTGNDDMTFITNYNALLNLFNMDKVRKQKYLEVIKLYDTSNNATNSYIYENLKASLEKDYDATEINKVYNTLVFNYNNGDTNIRDDFRNTMNIYNKLKSTNLDNILTADASWKTVAAGNFKYGGTSIPVSNNVIDCSSFISWVLQQNGYSEFQGSQHVTQQFYLTNWNKKYGWEEIPVLANEDVSKKLQVGDILVRDPGDNNGHMNMVADIITLSDGSVKILAYDCGDDDNWKNSNGMAIDKTAFAVSDPRPGKIIRIPGQ